MFFFFVCISLQYRPRAHMSWPSIHERLHAQATLGHTALPADPNQSGLYDVSQYITPMSKLLVDLRRRRLAASPTTVTSHHGPVPQADDSRSKGTIPRRNPATYRKNEAWLLQREKRLDHQRSLQLQPQHAAEAEATRVSTGHRTTTLPSRYLDAFCSRLAKPDTSESSSLDVDVARLPVPKKPTANEVRQLLQRIVS